MKWLFLHGKVFASISARACLRMEEAENCMGDDGPGAGAECVGAGQVLGMANGRVLVRAYLKGGHYLHAMSSVGGER